MKYGKMTEEKLKGLVRAAACCPLMVKAKQGKSAFGVWEDPAHGSPIKTGGREDEKQLLPQGRWLRSPLV